MRKAFKVIRVFIASLLVELLLIVGGAYLYYHFRDSAQAASTTWGLTFSVTQSKALGLDWKANYEAILDDLHPDGIRLIAGWDTIEPTENAYDYADLDWQVSEAAKRNVPVIIAIGQKVPRWPECHIPSWASPDEDARGAQLLAYDRTTVERYRNAPNLLYWQVENEPYLAFGSCEQKDTSVISDEVSLTHSLDARHPVMITDGGEWGLWYPAALRADVFGTTMYRYVYDGRIQKAQRYYLPPEYYQAKADLTRLLTGKPNLKVFVSELGTEPWGNKQIADMTLDEQRSFLTMDRLKETLSFATSTGFDTYYLWGSEWWYYAKVNGDPSYWNEIKQVIAQGKI